MEAAERLFSEHGYGGTSIQDIARCAGVSKANVFHHFKSKDALYRAVLGCACERAQERVIPLLGGGGEFPERLRRAMEADIGFLLEDPQRTHLLLREIAETRPDQPDQPAPAALRESCLMMLDMVRAAQASGEIRGDIDPAAVVLLFFAANVFYFQTRNAMRHFPEIDFADDPERYAGKLSELILHGIVPHE